MAISPKRNKCQAVVQENKWGNEVEYMGLIQGLEVTARVVLQIPLLPGCDGIQTGLPAQIKIFNARGKKHL